MDLKNIITPSPTASTLGQYGNLPISLYTGTTNISIPIYEVSAGSLKLPISLSYNSGGIKVADITSSVGLGWVLNSGGAITRTICGLPDEGSISDPYTITNSPTLGQIKWSLLGQSAPNYTDMQPDIFYFNFNGKSGRFIITKTSLVSITPHQNLKIQAYRNDGSVQDPPFTGLAPLTFRITDEDGIVYEFKDYEVNSTTSFEGNNTDDDPPLNGQGRYAGGLTCWYLSRMISPQNDTISFVYNNYNLAYDIPSSEQQYVFVSAFGDVGIDFSDHERYVKNVTACKNQNKRLQKIIFPSGSVNFSYSRSRKDLVGDSELNTISIYNNDGLIYKAYSLNYQYSLSPTFIPNITSDGGVTLTNNSYDNYYTPYYKYKKGLDGSSTASYRRLMLMGISELDTSGNATGKRYSFDYDFSYGGLPSRFSKSRDYWGYFNNSTDDESSFSNYELVGTDKTSSDNYLLIGKDADSNYCGQNSLIKITYPTGGSTQMGYQLHKAYLGKGVLPPDVLPQSCQMSIDYTNYHNLGYTDTTINSIPCLYKAFTINSTGETIDISVSGIPYQGQGLHPIGFNVYNDSSKQLVVSMYDLYNSNQTIDPTWNRVTCNLSPYLPYGTYKVIFSPYNTSDIGNDSYHSTYGLNPAITVNGWANIIVHPDSIPINRYIGGLRTKYITDFDPQSNQSIQTNYYYTLPNDTLSSGELVSGANYVYDFNEVEHSELDVDRVITPYTTVSKYKVINSESNYALSTTQGSYVGYSVVIAVKSDPITGVVNGKTEYYYTSPNLFPDSYGIVPGTLLYSYDPPTPNLSYSPATGPKNPYPYVPADNRDWQRGLLLQKIDYKYAGNQYTPIHYETNTYGQPQYLDTTIGFTTRYYQEAATPTSDTVLYMSYSQTTPLPFQEVYAAKQYCYISGYVPLLSKTITSTENGVSLTTTESYAYDDAPSNLLITSRTLSNSLNEVTTTRFKYPFDYTITATPNNNTATGIQNLQNLHIISPVIERYIQKSNVNGTNLRTIAGSFTTYKPTTPYPDVVYSLEISQGITNYQPVTITASNTTMNSANMPQLYFDIYDNNGNLLQQHKTNDINHSYIWDYNNSLPIAEVANSPSSDIAYTSFEADGKGNWNNFGGTISTVSSSPFPPTGNKYYNLTPAASLSKSVTAGIIYIISYWSKNGAYTINGGTGTFKTGRVINDWIYYEHKVTASSTILTITGTGSIDEVRLYPDGAQMTSFTYAPLIGISSQCDMNNRITYYEYDNLQRLKLIRDQDNNIVKRFDYQYQQQP